MKIFTWAVMAMTGIGIVASFFMTPYEQEHSRIGDALIALWLIYIAVLITWISPWLWVIIPVAWFKCQFTSCGDST